MRSRKSRSRFSNDVLSSGAAGHAGRPDGSDPVSRHSGRYVATQRADGNHAAVYRAVRSSMGIHLALGSILAGAGWLLAPAMTARLIAPASGLGAECLWSLRIACILLLVRAVESVCIGTQRAFERYGAAVGVSAAGRGLSLGAAAVLPLWRPSVAVVLIATAVISGATLWIQLTNLAKLIQGSPLTPCFDRSATRILLGFGKFTWIQAVSTLVIGQMDRLLTGAVLGAAAVSSYVMCVQLCQPVYGVTAAGLHFLFPRITSQSARNDPAMRRTVFVSIALNLVAVVSGSAILLVFGNGILRVWGGPLVAESSTTVLPIVLCGTLLAALGIAGSYTMLAIGRVRVLTCLNLAAGAAMLGSAWWLLPHYGVRGVALARMTYGPIVLVVYAPMFVHLLRRPGREAKRRSGVDATATWLEEA
jgi:O-antigen/teichoic acid export membrane protein